jgi:hypothetical protein
MWLYMIDTVLTCTLNHVAMNALSVVTLGR